VEGRVAGQQVRAGRSQELLVRSFERHGLEGCGVLVVSTGDGEGVEKSSRRSCLLCLCDCLACLWFAGL
jgi:hypothetical protein